MKFDKDDTRKSHSEVVECAIQLMYKSYLMRGDPTFLQKVEKSLRRQKMHSLKAATSDFNS